MEPNIVVDGHVLTDGEAMTVRVALCSFLAELKEDGLGDDETGKAITDGYIRNGKNVLKKMNIFK